MPPLEPWTLLIATHAIAASLSLVLGLFQVLRRRRGDPVHKLTGRIWVALMVYVSVVSFGFGGYSDGVDIFLRCLAVWTLISVTVGIVCARLGKIGVHRIFMVGTYLGLIGAFIGVIAVHTRRVPSWFVAHPLGMSVVAIAVLAVAGIVIAGVLQRYRTTAPASAGNAV